MPDSGPFECGWSSVSGPNMAHFHPGESSWFWPCTLPGPVCDGATAGPRERQGYFYSGIRVPADTSCTQLWRPGCRPQPIATHRGPPCRGGEREPDNRCIYLSFPCCLSTIPVTINLINHYFKIWAYLKGHNTRGHFRYGSSALMLGLLSNTAE